MVLFSFGGRSGSSLMEISELQRGRVPGLSPMCVYLSLSRRGVCPAVGPGHEHVPSEQNGGAMKFAFHGTVLAAPCQRGAVKSCATNRQ